jgi:hypothetical protein
MSLTNLARIAKIVAVVGFVLPWLAVSCSGHRMLTASGLSLAMGEMTITNPLNGADRHIHGHPNWWLAAAGGVIVLGLVLGLALRGRQAAQVLLAGSIAGAVLSAAGLWSVCERRSHDVAAFEAEALGVGRQGGVTRFDTLYGFWMTLAGLAAAGALSGAALGARENPKPP